MTMNNNDKTTSDAALDTAMVRVVTNDKLYVSEPPPEWFGNAANPPKKDSANWTNKNWLKSRFHFSFAEYHNMENQNFGVMRVMNDDLVQPKRGFGSHPHRNMEIITYIVEGELTHQDSMGSKETLGRGSVQFMTAGTGVVHSEFNHGDKPLRFIQTWITPSKSFLPPNYGSYDGSKDKDLRTNKLHHLVSRNKETSVAPVKVNQDVNAFASELELGTQTVHELQPGRQAYLLCLEGSVNVNNKVLDRHDACEIQGGGDRPTKIEIEASATEQTEDGRELAHILMFEMKQTPGSGRRDL